MKYLAVFVVLTWVLAIIVWLTAPAAAKPKLTKCTTTVTTWSGTTHTTCRSK